jgi:hypothetical protein
MFFQPAKYFLLRFIIRHQVYFAFLHFFIYFIQQLDAVNPIEKRLLGGDEDGGAEDAEWLGEEWYIFRRY